MRAIVQYDSLPAERECKPIGDGKRSVIFIRKDITEKTVEDADGGKKTVYECVEYTTTAQTISAEKISEDAVIEAETAKSAKAVRARRNALLDDSDAQVLPDRNKSTSTAYKEWAAYRQDLRDITKQEGFPFDVEWPEKPEG